MFNLIDKIMKAIAKTVKMSPRKVRLVVDAVRGLSIDDALKVLSAMQKRAADPVIKTIDSAVANAITNDGREQANLMIASITVNEGQVMKRFHPSSRGRVHPYKKKSSHITVILKDKIIKAEPVSEKPKLIEGKVIEKDAKVIDAEVKTQKKGGNK